MIKQDDSIESIPFIAEPSKEKEQDQQSSYSYNMLK